jgi:hypothetical protein
LVTYRFSHPKNEKRELTNEKLQEKIDKILWFTFRLRTDFHDNLRIWTMSFQREDQHGTAEDNAAKRERDQRQAKRSLRDLRGSRQR